MTTAALRAITHRLTTTPVDQLPWIASFLATSLSDCAELFSAPQAQKPGKSESDHAAQIHKLKTRLASLLQDRSPEARWAAVVLVKATVEAGQWEILRGIEPIVRSLIGILAKPDPISTRKMCIITLTRIFHLTYQYPTLVREVTTPHLPGFITAALNLVSVLVKLPSGSSRKPKPNTPFMETVLHAFLELIGRHPTIFRPFGSQLRVLLGELIGSSSPAYFPEHVVDAAEQLFVSLHKCAPKDKSASEWTNDCRATVLSIHRTADHVFRGVVEQWESTDATLTSTQQDYSQEMGDAGPDDLGLPGWRGIHSGADRMITLLRMLSDFVLIPSASVAIPLGSILDVTSRLTSVTVPPESGDSSQHSVQFNLQIGRDEREMLWTELPRIHNACMDLLSNVASILESSGTPIAQTVLDQAFWVFRNEKFNRGLRSAIYDLLRSLVLLNGPAMTKQSVAPLAIVLRSCCHDLVSPSGDSGSPGHPQSDPKTKSKTSQATANADSFLNPDLQNTRQAQTGSRFPELQRNASQLLQAVLAFVPSELLSPSIRAEIDRTIILTSDKGAMLASVLNPVPAVKGRSAGSSILPFLVRSYSDQMEVEALVRPRMPVVITGSEVDAYAESDEEDEVEDLAEEPYNAAPQTADFLKQPVSAPIQAQEAEPSTAPDPMLSSYKRPYGQESHQSFDYPSAELERQGLQIKKARIEGNIPSSLDQQSLGLPLPAAATDVSAPSVLQPASATFEVGTSGVQAQTSPSHVPVASTASHEPKLASQPVAARPGPVDDSDDELPALNPDPDTEEEEEDVDATMEG